MAVEFSQEFGAQREQLHRYLVSITHDRDVADDVAQEACIRLVREVAQSRPPRHTRAWLHRVGLNLVIDQGRRKQRAVKLQERLWDGRVARSAEDEYLHRESRLDLQRLLAQLNRVDRTALQMAADGYSGAEIAKALGMTEGSVRTRMSRARRRLRDLLGPVS